MNKRLMEFSRTNWQRIPERMRERCLGVLRTYISKEARIELREKGLDYPHFDHFYHGMQIRNKLRGVLLDDGLPEVEQPDGSLAQNWDDFYLGALEELINE